MQIIFIGPPGSGKGTQCELLSQASHIPHLSTGELLRRTKGQSPLGDLVSSYIDRGCLAPDFLILPLVMRLLGQPDFKAGCLFDGFPRTVFQAEHLREHLRKRGDGIDLVFHLHVPEQELVDRLLLRSSQEGRVDDHREGIVQRLAIYRKRTEPVLEFYQGSGVVRRIEGSATPESVHEQIMREVIGLRKDRYPSESHQA